MLELDDISSKAIEVASVIQKSINTVGIEATITAVSKKDQLTNEQILELQDTILTKGTINFTLTEQDKPRYFVHINVETKEVEVEALPVKTQMHLGKLELNGGKDAT
jgi:hypothetical protein